MANIEANKEKFISLLVNTGRGHIHAVIEALEKSGFFTAPASTKYHGAYEGGLCEHSLNVYRQAMEVYNAELQLDPKKVEGIHNDNIAIAALLHDVCKADIYKTEQKFRKDANGRWQTYTGYGVDYSSFPLGHGEKSVIWLLKHNLEMTDEEILAIRWHMTKWDMSDGQEARSNFGAAVEKTPLVPIIAAADQLATWITEVEYNTTP